MLVFVILCILHVHRFLNDCSYQNFSWPVTQTPRTSLCFRKLKMQGKQFPTLCSETCSKISCLAPCLCVQYHKLTEANDTCTIIAQPRTGHEGPEGEYRYASTLSLTSALDGAGWSIPRLCRSLPPGKTRYPLYKRLGGPHGRYGPVRKISPSPEFDPRTVQPITSRYTDWAIPARHVYNSISVSPIERVIFLVFKLLYK